MSQEGLLKPTLENLGNKLIPEHTALNETTYPIYKEVGRSLANLKQVVTSLNWASSRDLLKTQNSNADWIHILRWYHQLVACDEKQTIPNYLKIVENLNMHLLLFQKNMRSAQQKRYEYRTRSKDYDYMDEGYYTHQKENSLHYHYVDKDELSVEPVDDLHCSWSVYNSNQSKLEKYGKQKQSSYEGYRSSYKDYSKPSYRSSYEKPNYTSYQFEGSCKKSSNSYQYEGSGLLSY